MKYCTHCGKELSDEIKICTGCGCVSDMEEESTSNNTKNINNKKKILIIIIAVVSAIALIVGGFFLVKHIRIVNVIKYLSGEEFTYYDSRSYPALGLYDYTEKEMKFDDDGKLTYSYYFSNIDRGGEYERDYKIKFKNKMIILKAGLDEYEIQYDKYNKIEGIYDIENEELYD